VAGPVSDGPSPGPGHGVTSEPSGIFRQKTLSTG
jgi:hypothetical protein